jgi:hypothetical protein
MFHLQHGSSYLKNFSVLFPQRIFAVSGILQDFEGVVTGEICGRCAAALIGGIT